MKYLYIDSSILVSVAIEDPSRAAQTLKMVESYEQCVTSELSVVEGQAGICQQLRSQPEAMLEAEQNLNRFLSNLLILGVNSLILGQARALVRLYRVPVGLRSSDAIHIATANSLKEAYRTSPRFRVEYLTADLKQHQVFTVQGYTGKCLN